MQAVRGNRVVVVGTTGSGKTTFAAALARSLGVPHIELDALRWRPGWTETPDDEFAAAVDGVTAEGGWVVDGNYAVVRDLLLARATDVVWFDLPRRVVMYRVVKRSLGRVLFRRTLWNGNRESWRDLLRADHPVRWAWTSHPRRRADYAALSAGDPRWSRVHGASNRSAMYSGRRRATR